MKTDPSVIFEDNHLLVVFKPSGWLSQADKTGDKCITDWGKEYLRKKHKKTGNVFCGLPHRLDRPVSGVMVLAKTSKSLERLNKMFLEDQVQKTYYALVVQRPPKEDDTLIHWLLKDPKNNTVKAFQNEKKGAKKAELYYELLNVYKTVSVLKVLPVSGRPHQIRVQLKAMGCPIMGDVKYGGVKVKELKESIALHAGKITFVHPVKKEKVTFEAPVKSNRFMERFKIQIN